MPQSQPNFTLDPRIPLRKRIEDAVKAVFGAEIAGQDPVISRSTHADYQVGVAMALARQLSKKPRDVAVAIVAHLPEDDVIASAVPSGPGFINLTLQSKYLDAQLALMLADPRLGVPLVSAPQKVVVDYSGPNVAKEMHVGHLRSTIIGDSLARVLEFQGHAVIRQNHVGDWGTPFGMLIEHLIDQRSSGGGASVRELVDFYRQARTKFDGDEAFAERARRRVVLLQQGDEETIAQWRQLITVSVEHFTSLYRRLSVSLRVEDVAGESSYNSVLPGLVSELEQAGIARPSEGAICVFPPGFAGRDGQPTPLILRKQDGGYGYAVTDLAALRHRAQDLHAARLIYVVGAPQSQHLAMVFATARLAGWIGPTVRLEHVAFGSVLGADKKMFKTRAGESVSLSALIDEGLARALAAIQTKAPDLNPDEQQKIAEAVSVGAIKYADLSSDRIKDYVFDWNRMLAFDGNTAPYLMYANARCRSILRKAGNETASAPGRPTIEAPAERALGLHLLNFPAVVEQTAESLQPHRICQHLYEVATAYADFFENCPVLKAPEPLRASRLSLCLLTARVLEQGLALLGILAPERM
jgi:arginyl-tRNA synthetase